MTTGTVTVVTAGPLPDSFPLDSFAERCSFVIADRDELPDAVRDATVLYSWLVPDTVPAETPNLRWIQVPSAGVNHLRRLPLWESAITIVSSTGVHAVPMAEHFFALLLAFTRQIPAIVRQQAHAEWSREWRESTQFGEIRGKTLAIIGWGRIGDQIAHLARAFGLRVIGTRRSIDAEQPLPRVPTAYSDPPRLEPSRLPADALFPPSRTTDVLSQADIVLLTLPLTDQTRDSFGADQFAAMRPGSLFFNIGRGGVVDEGALIQALTGGHIAGAGLDVFAQEPLPASSPLWQLPNVIISPHVGGNGPGTDHRAAQLFAVNLGAFLRGDPLLNVVDRNIGY